MSHLARQQKQGLGNISWKALRWNIRLIIKRREIFVFVR